MNSIQHLRREDIPLLGNLAVQQYRLANGLQIAVVVDKTTPIFTYQTWFKVGSADEPAGRQGLAHLFEHMMFRKTASRPMGEFERIVNNNGGTGINAYTSRDQTVYFFTFPSDKVELAADLESDRMANLVVDAEMFETEKGAVLTEKNRGLDDPNRLLWETMYSLAYTEHNYRYSTIGEIETIKSFSVDEARKFYANNYSPNNSLIIIAGDVEPESVVRIVDEKYGPLKPAVPDKRDVTAEPVQREPRSTVITHPKATRRLLAKSWHVPDMLHPDYPALAVVGKLLTSGKSAVLNERLLNTAKATEVFSDVYVSHDMGTFELYVQCADGEPFESVDQTFLSCVSEFAEGKISDEQMQIVRNNLQREMYRAVTVPAQLARLLGDGFINTGDLSFQIKAMKRIEAVDKNDIQRVAAKYLLEGKSTTVQLIPEQKV
ncbi:MAG TPA: pitrilysin family protein [Bacteroidota bacterium]|nr:pitrilysin family protein [Bacteroidota bacterium]